jgi:bacterioferritin-associated ferredoxin
MAPAFVFAEQVREIIRSGKKEFDVPQGARISAAAMELIKDHGIEVHYLSSETISDKAGSEERAASADVGLEQKRPDQKESEKTTAINNNDPPSKEVIEEIVDRVIERFYQLKEKESVDPGVGRSVPGGKEVDGRKDDDLVICRCEEITREEIRDAIKNGFQTLNGIKRVTRAGMGLCQGQTCQRLITQILSEELGVTPADIEPTTARGPVRPIRLAVFANS